MKRVIYRVLFLFLSLTFFEWTGCGAGTEVSNPPTSTTTKLLSSSLLDVDPQLRSLLPFPVIKEVLSNDCAGGLESCLTPGNVTGKVYYAGVMVGIESGYSVGPIVGAITDASQITSFPQEDLLDFDLEDQTTLDGDIVCCGGSPYPEDDEAIASMINIYFAYVDATITLDEGDVVDASLVGTHTIRTVFGSVDGTTLTQGDLLYKGSGASDFSWCTTDGGCAFSTRPSSPIQNSEIVDYSGSEDGLGNQTIPNFFANIDDSDGEIILTESDVLNNSLAFTVDFSMENAVGFTGDAATFDSVADMVAAFRLAAEPGQGDAGFTATLEVEMTPVETTATDTGDSTDDGTEDDSEDGTDEGTL